MVLNRAEWHNRIHVPPHTVGKGLPIVCLFKCKEKVCLLGESDRDLPGLPENMDPHGQTFHWFRNPHAMKEQ